MLEEAGISKVEEDLKHNDIQEEIVAEYVISNTSSIDNKNAPDPVENPETGWLDPAVRILISMVEEISPIVGKVPQFRTKIKMWEEIQSRLQNEGYSFTIKQITNKFFSLKRGYTMVKQHNFKKKRAERSHPYENELDDIFEIRKIKNKRKRRGDRTISPSGHADDSEGYELRNNVAELAEAHLEGSGVTFRAEVMTELRSMREESNRFHSRILSFIETTENKKIKLMEERNSLLKRLLDKF
ncbi:uncharacterized protein LOC131685263 isoform X2 [Topomyia yanbarensis]|nr:uncharacterized protein LOC131685263 isoform X2 [Topomyia yanbarensis]